MAQGLSSLLGGLAQGFTDLGKSTLDVLGGGTTNNVLTAGLDALINKKSYGQAVKDANQRQKDFRKWLYETDSDKDAAAKGLGTALNGAQTAIDLIPGLGQSAPVNAIQGAIGGLADEFKFNGENYDWGKGAQRAAVGAGAGLAAGGLGKALANSGSKVLSNGVLKGAATGSLGGALSQAGGTAIEGGNADQILQSAAQGAQFGALLGAGTGGVQSLAGALKKTRAKNGAPAIMDDEVVMAELAPEQNAVAGAMLSPEQREYFKDSVLRDPEGNLMRVYHSTPNEFTAFDDSRLGDNTAWGNTAFGHFVTPDKDFSARFRDIDNHGYKGNTMELYANVKKPILHPYGAEDKYKGKDLDKIVEDWYKATNNAETIEAIKGWQEDMGNDTLHEAYLQMMEQEGPWLNSDWEREQLQKNGYDAVEFIEGPRNRIVDGATEDTPVSSYAIFGSNQLKDINNLTPTDNVDIMAERVAPGQLGLFDQTQTTTPKTATTQLGLFDQPTQPVTPKTIDVADVNPYAPVNGKVTQTMRDRAAETMKNYRKGIPENELWNRIDPETLPEGYMQLRDVLDQDAAQAALKQRFGTTDMKKVDFEKLLDYTYGDAPEQKNRVRAIHNREYAYTRDRADRLGISMPKNYATDTEKSLRKLAESKASDDVIKNLKKQLESEAGIIPKDTLLNISDVNYKDDSFRTGYTAAADNALSERLGIAPGNTLKRNGRFDTAGAYGRYAHRFNNGWGQQHKGGNIAISPSKTADPEDAISSMAHERLHSFQNEATNPDNATGRYDKEVLDAYNNLNKDLKEFMHDTKDVASRYGRSAYWAKPIEQEARMLQNYLENKGYTDSGHMKGKYRAGEWGDEINPAFDKFFDKLRELSKKGVALPAILAALGLGEYATENQEEDKDNGQQI